MDSAKEFELYCHFCGIGKKLVRAASFEEAKQMVEDDEHICFDEIIRLTKPCWVDEAISKQLNDPNEQNQHAMGYKNWGSE